MNKNKKKNKIKEMFNILFCGTGGQGVLTASEILAQAAVSEGYHVKKSEVHGMAQRGGSVESHLRFGTKVFSPLIPKGTADYLVVFHPEEGKRLKDFLSKKGVDLSCVLETKDFKQDGQRFINTYLLGVLSIFLPIKESSWLNSLEKKFRNRNFEENQRVFFAGRRLGQRLFDLKKISEKKQKI